MKALVYENYGTWKNLEIKEVPRPVPADNEVLVKVHAASLNDWDVALLTGDFVNRMLNGWMKPRITILGSDIAGVVESIGKDVKALKIGDRVYGDLSNRWGGFAEFVCANEDAVARIPSKMTFEEAAAIPQAGMLAVQGLIDRGNIRAGQQVLVNGAGGGVGTYAVQIAKTFGVEMTGVDRREKLEMLTTLGYDYVIDYQMQDFTNTGKKYDLILDTKTNRPIAHYLRALKSGGRYVTVGGEIPRLLQLFLFAPVVSVVTRKKVSVVALKPNKDLVYMNQLFEAGKLKSVIDGPYRFEDARSAFKRFAEGLHQGKIVLRVAE